MFGRAGRCLVRRQPALATWNSPPRRRSGTGLRQAQGRYDSQGADPRGVQGILRHSGGSVPTRRRTTTQHPGMVCDCRQTWTVTFHRGFEPPCDRCGTTSTPVVRIVLVALTTPVLEKPFSWTTAWPPRRCRNGAPDPVEGRLIRQPTFVDARPGASPPVARRKVSHWRNADPDIQELPVALYHRLVDSLAYAA